MRCVVIGAGAIGGSVGARLHQAGHDVLLVARGEHGATLAEKGLRFRTPTSDDTLQIPVVPGSEDVHLHADDVLLLCVKLQDSVAALGEWAARPLPGGDPAGDVLPLFCLQNGVAGERMALRRFARVYGVQVALPATFLSPGDISAVGAPLTGILTIGRFPVGVHSSDPAGRADEPARNLAAALTSAHFRAPFVAEVMRWKYTKLLANLANALEVICGPGDDLPALHDRATHEARSVYRAAGIEWASPEEDRAARVGLTAVEIPGVPRGGGSSWQSLTRGSGSVEADYLNGEIVLLGRLHGVPTPINAILQRLANRSVRESIPPGRIGAAELTQIFDAAGPPGQR